MQIRPLERRPKLSRQAGEYLARLIGEGAFKAGDRLPSESVLARQLGVSRPTVREAIGALEARGLVEVRPRSGVFVTAALSLDAPEGIQELISVDPARLWDLLEIRKIIDAEGAALAAERRTPEDIASLRALAEEVRGQSAESLLRRETGGKAYVAFFSLLAAATHNTLFDHLRRSIDRLVQNALPASRLRLQGHPEAAETIRTQLLSVLDAVVAGAPSQARRSVRIHLEYLEKALLG